MERGEQTPDDLDRPDGNSLLENYESHDVGMRYVADRFAEADVGHDLDVEEWGIDRRHDDGEDGVIYDDKMDLKVHVVDSDTESPTETTSDSGSREAERDCVGIVEVKTKTSSKWMGQFNLRHYEDYMDIAEEHDEKFVWLVMLHVIDDEVVDGFIWFVDSHPSEDVLRSDEDDIYTFPDGNGKAILPHSCRATIDVFDQVLGATLTTKTDHETEDRT